MGNAVDFHCLPFQPPRGVELRATTLSSSIQEFGRRQAEPGVTDFRKPCIAAVMLGAIAPAVVAPALSAPCSFEPQGEGRVGAIIDPRSFRMDDGGEVRLAGIEI